MSSAKSQCSRADALGRTARVIRRNNKDTFYPNIDVKSIFLHDTRRDLPDQVMEGEEGWVMQGILSRVEHAGVFRVHTEAS